MDKEIRLLGPSFSTGVCEVRPDSTQTGRDTDKRTGRGGTENRTRGTPLPRLPP